MVTSYFLKSRQSNFGNYYFLNDALTKDEIDSVLTSVEFIPSQDAIIEDSNRDTNIRTSIIKWIPKNQDWEWLYYRIFDIMNIANNSMWNLDITTMFDMIQYTEYYATENGHYDWHMDVGSGEASYRKVSISIQICDADDFEGGDLQMWLGGTSFLTMPKGMGNAAVFPSFFMHRVSPITKGVRKSLVMWAGGTPYR